MSQSHRSAPSLRPSSQLPLLIEAWLEPTLRCMVRADGNLLEVVKNLATISRAPIQVGENDRPPI